MSALYPPDARLNQPELFYKGRKPVGKVKVDWSHPIARGAAHKGDLLLFNSPHDTPYNEVSGRQWRANTTYGATPYNYEPVNGNINFSRQDIDEAGISYYGDMIGEVETGLPFYLICIFTVIQAPSGANKGILQREVVGVPRSGAPYFLLTSASASLLKFYINNAYVASDIPVAVGEKHIFVHHYDGNSTHNTFDSIRGTWSSSSGGSSRASHANANWIGTGYAAESPCAFELFISGFYNVPNLEELKKFTENPYQFLVPDRG